MRNNHSICKHIFLFTLIFLSTSIQHFTYSQETTNPYKITLNGYVRADALFDTRQAVEAREGFLLFYPKKPVLDAEGKDINAKPSFNQYTMTTRLTARISGPELLGAKTSALIESDFTGASNIENNSLRLRHAYMNFQWQNTRLLVGQYWHPLDVPEMIPFVLSLNTGAPFHSFSRQPQIRVDYTLGNFILVGVVASQRDYVNSGPDGNSPNYLRNSVIPNLHGQLQYKKGKTLAGAGVDYKRLTPRLVTLNNYKANENLDCFSYTAFFTTAVCDFSVKTQYTFNQALNDHLMMGGFAVTSKDLVTDRREYTPLNYHSIWANLAYTKTSWQPSIFMGYTVNMGSEKEVVGEVYARDANIDYVYRISPMLSYVKNKLSFNCELEYTVAAYGTNDINYKVINSSEVGNLRIGLGATYSF